MEIKHQLFSFLLHHTHAHTLSHSLYDRFLYIFTAGTAAVVVTVFVAAVAAAAVVSDHYLAL